MRKTLLTLATLVVALAIAFAVRAYVVTICTVPDATFTPTLHKGQPLVVSRIATRRPHKGDIIVFAQDGAEYLGRIALLPGDTLTLADSRRYVIPNIARCPHCGSDHPRNYLVATGGSHTLVHETHVAGRMLFALPWP